MTQRYAAFTLIEIMAGIVIFSAILGTLFSVTGSIRKTERFRDDTIVVTNAAQLGFEPMIAAINQSDAIERVKMGTDCVTVRGFYGIDGQGQIIFNRNPQSLRIDGSPVEVDTLATIDREEIKDAQLGTLFRWIKRVYSIEDGVLIERTYVNNSWPAALDSCQNPVIWSVSPQIKQLTGKNVTATNLLFRVSAPLLEDTNVTRNSPFVTLALQVRNPRTKIGVPVELKTTIVPTFSYGETIDVPLH